MTVIELSFKGKHDLFDRQRHNFLGAPFDGFNAEMVIDLLRKSPADLPFRYIVTPNVDHVVRLKADGGLLRYYRAAWMSLCDSKPIQGLAGLLRLRLPLVTGSDLTVSLFQSVIQEGDAIAIIAATEHVVSDLRKAYPKLQIKAFVPPMGVASDPQAFEACVNFAVDAHCRFLFLAIGAPQSERIAYEVSRRAGATGIGLCIGASLEFLTGVKKRAPRWMRRLGLEWLHRLSTDPKRLWRRYAYAVLPLLALFSREIGSQPRRRASPRP
jgi:exopolysaccharide biosynthesis WecB/TagA/CpsF family protein